MSLRHLLTFVLAAGSAFAQDANYKLVFEENFDGAKLDTATWDIQSNSKQRGNYTDEAVSLKDGVLSITTWTENKADLTGRIKMKKSKYFDFRQGKIEGRLRFNPMHGISTLFVAGTDEEDTKSPQVNMDIFVSWGFEKGAAYMTGVNWKDPGNASEPKEAKQRNIVAVGKYWHTYGVEWDGSGYQFTMDGKTRMSVKNAKGIAAHRGIDLGCVLPAAEHAGPKGGYGPKERSKATYEIDWVKAWKYVPPAK
jgi:hypothetical protein